MFIIYIIYLKLKIYIFSLRPPIAGDFTRKIPERDTRQMFNFMLESAIRKVHIRG